MAATWVLFVTGPAFGVLQDIKTAIDPLNIMNPGKMGFSN